VTPQVHAQATEPHFVDHLAPVWQALPPETRGQFHVGSRASRARAAHHGITPAKGRMPKTLDGIALAAAVGDLRRIVKITKVMPVVFFEHGCGLTYSTRRSSYAGAKNRPNVVQFVFPNEWSAGPQRAAHPHIPVDVIGSTPKLDRWCDIERNDIPANVTPTVAVSFHWDCEIVPETRSALGHYRKALAPLKAALAGEARIVGHSHPRIVSRASAAFREAGIEFWADFDRVLAEADLYAVDNSSTLYEFASTDRPVVALNCPLYRRHVDHGLRFWEHIPGLECDAPDQLPDVIREALLDPPGAQERRRNAIREVYPLHDGRSAERAAELVLAALEEHGEGIKIGGRRRPRREWHFGGGPEPVVFLSWGEASRFAVEHPDRPMRMLTNDRY